MKKTKISLRRWKLSPLQRSNASIVHDGVIHDGVIAIGAIGLEAIISMIRLTTPRILRRRRPTLLPGAWVLKRWIDPPQADLKEARVPLKTASKFSANRNLAKASLKFRAKVLDSCATRNATSCRHRRIFL